MLTGNKNAVKKIIVIIPRRSGVVAYGSPSAAMRAVFIIPPRTGVGAYSGGAGGMEGVVIIPRRSEVVAYTEESPPKRGRRLPKTSRAGQLNRYNPLSNGGMCLPLLVLLAYFIML